MNKVFLSGRLTANPTTFASANANLSNARFDLAASDSRNNRETYFFPCVVFGVQANYVINYLKKGDFVIIEGRITRRNYTTKDGRTGTSTDIVVDNIQSVNNNSSNQYRNPIKDLASSSAATNTFNSVSNQPTVGNMSEEKVVEKVSIDESFGTDEDVNPTNQANANQKENSKTADPSSDDMPDWYNELDED